MSERNWWVKHCIAAAEIQEGDLVAYLDGEASPSVTRHIALCPACSAEIKALRRADFLLRQAFQSAQTPVLPMITPPVQPPAVHNVLIHSKHQAKRSSSLNVGRLSWSYKAVASFTLAVATLIVVFAGLLRLKLTIGQPDPISSTQSIANIADVPNETIWALGVDNVIMAEAAEPDLVQQRRITRQNSSIDSMLQPGLDDLFDGIDESNLSGASGLSKVEPRMIIKHSIIDVVVAERIVFEQGIEIAPPLDLRRMFEQELKNEANDFLVGAKPINDKSSLIDNEGNEYKVWADNRSGVTTLYFSRSIDGGQTWSSDIQIDDRIGKVFSPKLALDLHGNLYVVWRNWYNIDSNVFYFARSDDQGYTWSDVVRIEDDTTGQPFRPNLAVNADNGHLYVTWENRRSASTGIYFTHSADGGQTWSDKQRMVNIGS